MAAEDGKLRFTDCVNTKNAFRLIQSIPSKKAEPFKQWLAQLAQERIEEIENPELAQNRVKEYYELKGYPKDWIGERLRGIAVRQHGLCYLSREHYFGILHKAISTTTFINMYTL